MNSTLATGSELQKKKSEARDRTRALQDFREYFKCALTRCVKKGFSIQESFRLIWEETLERFCPSEADQPRLYDELLAWARETALHGNGQ